MKNIKATAIFTLFISVMLISCGPSAVVVRERPAAPVYVRSVSPGPGYVWVGGAWVGNGRNDTYRQGYWAVPPRGRVVYREGYWAPRKGGYYYRQGGWRR